MFGDEHAVVGPGLRTPGNRRVLVRMYNIVLTAAVVGRARKCRVASAAFLFVATQCGVLLFSGRGGGSCSDSDDGGAVAATATSGDDK